MADTETSLYRKILALIQEYLQKCLGMLQDTPASKFIDLLKQYEGDHASNVGIALGALIVIAIESTSDVTLILAVIAVMYVVKKIYDDREENQWICSECKEQFDSEHGLKVHIGKIHEG